MATASLAAEVGGAEDGKPETVWLGVIAFGSAAEDLLRCRKGELCSVGGRLQMNRWTDDQGAERERLQVVAASLASAHTARPRGGARRAVNTPGSTRNDRSSNPDDLELGDDDLPF